MKEPCSQFCRAGDFLHKVRLISMFLTEFMRIHSPGRSDILNFGTFLINREAGVHPGIPHVANLFIHDQLATPCVPQRCGELVVQGQFNGKLDFGAIWLHRTRQFRIWTLLAAARSVQILNCLVLCSQIAPKSNFPLN